MKRIWFAAMIFMLLLLLSACGGKDTEEVSLDLDTIADTLTASGYFPSSLEALDAEMVAGQLSLYEDRIDANPEDLVDARYSMALGVLADQFILLEGTDSEATDRLEQALTTYAEDQKSSFEFYKPEQAARLDNPIVERRGNYLLFAIGTNQNESSDLCVRLMNGEKVEVDITVQKQKSELPKDNTLQSEIKTPAENQLTAESGSSMQNQETGLPEIVVQQSESRNNLDNTTGESASVSSTDVEAARQAALDYYAGTVFEIDTLTEINLLNGWEGEIMFNVTCSKGGVPQVDRTIALGRQDGIWTVTGEGY